MKQSDFEYKSVVRTIEMNELEISLDDFFARQLKRAFDIAFSLCFLLFIFSWLFPILAILIKLTSKGPIFFIQERTGVNLQTFKCIKFRSMYLNDESDVLQATNGDSRITPIGKLMRHTNLDEIPQFINVLLGDMSVVGPRPHMLHHTAEYSKSVDEYMLRHYIRPGVTGWAQINGYRGITDELWKMEKRVEFDMDYIRNWNFILDLKIVFLTIFDRRTYCNAG